MAKALTERPWVRVYSRTRNADVKDKPEESGCSRVITKRLLRQEEKEESISSWAFYSPCAHLRVSEAKSIRPERVCPYLPALSCLLARLCYRGRLTRWDRVANLPCARLRRNKLSDFSGLASALLSKSGQRSNRRDSQSLSINREHALVGMHE